jgi:hypothetical protein
MIFTVEPMINAGRREIREMGDGWTIKTKDRSLSAQWEHTVLVTETGFEVLTVSPGMPAPPAFIQNQASGVILAAGTMCPPACRSFRHETCWGAGPHGDAASSQAPPPACPDCLPPMPTLAITLKKQLKAARQQAIEVFQSNHKTEQLLAQLRRNVDEALTRPGKNWACPAMPRWWPWAAMAAASCSRIRTWMC